MTAESMFIDPNHGMRTYDNPGDGEYHRAGNDAWYARVEATVKAATGREPDWHQIELAVILDRAVRHDEGWRKVASAGGRRGTNESQRLVVVCDKCSRASCWQGQFMCEDAKTAGTTERTVAELRKLDREHEDWWSK